MEGQALFLFLLMLWVGTLGRSHLLDSSGPARSAVRGTGLGPGSHGILPRCLNYVLEELKHNSKAAVMVASHNEDTIRFTLHR